MYLNLTMYFIYLTKLSLKIEIEEDIRKVKDLSCS